MVKYFFRIILILTSLLSIGAWIYPDVWFSLISPFKTHYALLTILLFPALWWKKDYRWLWVAGFVLLINSIDLALLITPSLFPQKPYDEKQLTVITANALAINRQPEMLTKYLAEENPDIIALQEYTFHLQDKMGHILPLYPYRKLIPSKGYFGIALLSKYPLKDTQVENYLPVSAPVIRGTIIKDEKEVEIVVVHTTPPQDRQQIIWRDLMLSRMAKDRKTWSENLIILGDLNITSFSPVFKDFLTQTELRDSRNGLGIQASWPEQLGGLGITLDHVLISENIVVLARETGPFTGSDHLPVKIQITF